MMNNNDNAILFEDSMDVSDKHGLVGEISIYRRNKNTGEKILHEHSKNVISISGYQWILMKMFNLYLDSPHNNSDDEDMGKDSTIIIPDMNNDEQMAIGISPTNYEEMVGNISANHFIQGFMVGNGGAAEDAITAKNTNYSFIKLRNAIPFRETTSLDSLDPTEANKYLGIYRPSANSGGVKAYYIKKFDETPHIYHSWWRDGQKWDYVDPVTPDDLGPSATNGQGKTNRIETYAECHLSLDENDCVAYFNHDGNTNTAMINELGLVAFDTIPGLLSTVEALYATYVKKLIALIYSNTTYDTDTINRIKAIASDIISILDGSIGVTEESHINEFKTTLNTIIDSSEIDFTLIKEELDSETNIEVYALYHDEQFVSETDHFKEYADIAASSVTGKAITDEAQRIKTITYYTFNSLPIQSDWEILIYYRIYAN